MAHSSTNISLTQYLQDVDNGKVVVPEFQRKFVWQKAKLLKLIASLLKGYPIGSFLLMQDTGEYAVREIEGVDLENKKMKEGGGRNLILDGQQRTTTAYQVFYGKGNYKFYIDYAQFVQDIEEELEDIEDKITDIIEDRLEEWLVILPSKKALVGGDEQRSKGYFPLENIINNKMGQDYSEWLSIYASSQSMTTKGFDQNKFARITRCNGIFVKKLVESVTSYRTSEIIIDNETSTNVVCTIFETINSTGQKLTILDLLNAKCYPINFMLRAEIDSVFESDDIFEEFDPDHDSLVGISLMKIIGLLVRKSCKKSELLVLTAYQIKDNWVKAVQYLKNALMYIREEFGVVGYGYLPYKDLVPVIAMVVNNDKFNDNDKNKKKLAKWYWHSVFTGYFDNATESKTAKSIKEILGTEREKGWFDEDSLIPQRITSEEVKLEAIDSLTSTQSAQYKAILNLIVLNRSQNLSAERELISSIKGSQLNDHHIYPKKFLTSCGIEVDMRNTILNRTLISSDINLKISDKAPNVYMNDAKYVGKVLTSEELLKHCIPYDITNKEFSKEIYEMFLSQRKTLILELVNSALKSI